MKGKLILVIWNEDELCRACDLRDADWFVTTEHEDGGLIYRVIKAKMPDGVVIDLSRRPSHGRELAQALRDSKATRDLPIFFVDGDDATRASVQERVAGAVFATWDDLPAALEQDLLHTAGGAGE